ncbi:AfsR/SARP family transcriptional regulator [Frankia sp. Ag45/Mut15]|uniref:AfsR/SARP family transcriptional regulator n=1 Tax=Frankia umida TaxID=573489 RepID=A0ABT0K4W6_9ACTN|nr:AfsR/SARP family transcriptional regulator [Frankia umida]MCK9878849.1 AfsR/SARP family transcriptional regulator [Frankia umida]
MKFRILGPVELESNGRLTSLAGTRQRGLLSTLLVSGNHPVSAEQLCVELWGENPPSTVDNALQAHVYRLRQALKRLAGADDIPPDLITRAPGYLLKINPDDLDMNVFRERIASARAVRTQDPKQAFSLLEKALELWRGTPLHEISAGPTCRGVAVQLSEEYVIALEEKLSLRLENEDPIRSVGELRRMSSMYPWRENIIEMLMLALYRCGRQAEALETYHEARGRLDRELGIEPSVGLRQRFQEILSQSPSPSLS